MAAVSSAALSGVEVFDVVFSRFPTRRCQPEAAAAEKATVKRAVTIDTSPRLPKKMSPEGRSSKGGERRIARR